MATAAQCDGCLGGGRCWICGGDGSVQRRSGAVDCVSCAASGRCAYCPVPVPVPQQPRTVVLLPQEAVAGARS